MLQTTIEHCPKCNVDTKHIVLLNTSNNSCINTITACEKCGWSNQLNTYVKSSVG